MVASIVFQNPESNNDVRRYVECDAVHKIIPEGGERLCLQFYKQDQLVYDCEFDQNTKHAVAVYLMENGKTVERFYFNQHLLHPK